MKSKPEWYVYKYNTNRKKIEVFNIFDHSGFMADFIKLYDESENKEYFSHRLKSSLRYYFWGKCEYEVLISPWIGDESIKKKIDIYSQVMINWEHFVNYCWMLEMEKEKK